MKEKIKKLIEKFKVADTCRHLTKELKKHPSAVPLLTLLIAITVIYCVSVFRENVRIFKVDSPSEMKTTKIFGPDTSNTSEAKDRILLKTIHENAERLQAANEELKKMKERLSSLESKSGVGSSPVTPANSPLPSSIPTAGTSAEIKPSQSQTPDTRPSGTERNESSHFGGEGVTQLRPSQFGFLSSRRSRGPSIISFPAKETSGETDLGLVVPPGSYVKAKVMTGVDAPEGKPYPVLLQLDFVNILPNKKHLDLSGCFLIAKAQGDLSTERVQMQATKLSCVSRSGRTFEREVNGFVADDADNNFAVSGPLQSKRDKVATFAFLASVVDGIGKAIQEAQTTKRVDAQGATQTFVSGDSEKYLLAGGASTAASTVTQWYLKQAESLLPTIKVGSGKDVWVVMQDSVSLPANFFKPILKGQNNETATSFVSRLLD